MTPSATADPALGALALALAENNLAARDLFDALAQRLRARGVDRALAELAAQIDRLDFQAAQAKLDELEASLAGQPVTP
jgi:hypothetical protein